MFHIKLRCIYKTLFKFNRNKLGELNVRTYRNGDEVALVELWESAYRDVGGYVPKSPEYWKWCVLQRPSVNPEDVLLIESNTRIVAYSVLAQKNEAEGHSGIVLEFAIDPCFSRKERQTLASRLISENENRSRQRGDELLNISIPNKDTAVVKSLDIAGYRAESGDVLQLLIVDLVLLLNKILASRKLNQSPLKKSTFRIELKPGYYRHCPHNIVRIDLNSEPPVTDSTLDADYTIHMDMSTLTDIIFRRIRINHALTSDAITIAPRTGTEPAKELLLLMTLKNDWFVPEIDGR